MVSFIVIGRNEGWKLTKCLNSIFNSIAESQIKKSEVIYVDSKSTDDSIQRVKYFHSVKVYSITGTTNAAIARNIGAIEAKGDILFFIDADIEIETDFLRKVITQKDDSLKYDCVSGYIDNLFYDSNWNLIKRVPEGYKNTLPTKVTNRAVNGGIFLIKAKYWNLIKGMRTKYKKNQDLDFALRLGKKGIAFTRVPALMGLHHTVDYRNENRMWRVLFSDSLLYPPVTTRDHILNPAKLKHTIRRQYTAILMLLTIILLILNVTLSLVVLAAYISLLFIKVYRNTIGAGIKSESRYFYFFKRLLFQTASDVIFWIGFMFFFPIKKEMKYIEVKL